MKKELLHTLLVLVLVFPVFADKYENAGMDYTKCLYENETPEARVKCFQGYLLTYPDTGKKFTRLAYCMLALNHFDTKNYVKTVEIGEKSLTIGVPDDGLLAKLLLAMGSAYGIDSSAVFDKSKAIKYTDQAIELAEKAGLKDIAQNARGLKTKLSAPPTPRMTPEQIFKKYYREGRYSEAIAQYKKLPDAVKNNPEIREIYAKSLLKSSQLDTALKEFTALYADNKKAKYATSISDIYREKAKRNRALYKDSAVYLIEASLLYQKEDNQANFNKAIKNAKYSYYELYNLNAKIDVYNKKTKPKPPSEEEIKKRVRKIEYLIRKEERKLEEKYPDTDPPDFELKTLNKLKKELERVKSGPGPVEDKEGAELLAQKEKVDKEFAALVVQVKSRI
jgi:tetratricopeptide (TPR) repeat protein